MRIRNARDTDITELSAIRSLEWGSQEYWVERISKYMKRKPGPMQALAERVVLVAVDSKQIVGFAAAHLTTRYNCDAELQWINVMPDFKQQGVASELLKAILDWLVKRDVRKVCVDVSPENITAEKFYAKHGAERLNEHWMIWNDISEEV